VRGNIIKRGGKKGKGRETIFLEFKRMKERQNFLEVGLNELIKDIEEESS